MTVEEVEEGEVTTRDKVELSTVPGMIERKSKDMISWFPIFFPLKVRCIGPPPFLRLSLSLCLYLVFSLHNQAFYLTNRSSC